MKLTIAVVLAMVVCVNSGALYQSNEPRTRNVQLANALEKFFGVLNNVLHCLPASATIQLYKHPFDIGTDHFKLKGSVSEFFINGFENWKFLNISYDKNSGSISIEYAVPRIYLQAEVDVDATVKLLGFSIGMSTKDVLKINLSDVRGFGGFKIATSANDSNILDISNFVYSVSVADIAVNDWNANQFVNCTVKEYLELIEKLYDAYILPEINTILNMLSVRQFVDYVEYATQQLKLMEFVDCDLNLLKLSEVMKFVHA